MNLSFFHSVVVCTWISQFVERGLVCGCIFSFNLYMELMEMFVINQFMYV